MKEMSVRLSGASGIVMLAVMMMTPSASTEPGSSHGAAQPPSWAEVRGAIQMLEAKARPLPRLAATTPDRSGYDVTKYTIRCDVDFQRRSIRGDVTVDAIATKRNRKVLDLDFHGFDITRVRLNGKSASYSRIGSGSVLRVRSQRPLNLNQAFRIEIVYNGVPSLSSDGLGFGFTASGAGTFAEPEGAREWFPCKDRPSDKAEYEGYVTVPSSMVVASNGALIGTSPSGDRVTYHWKEAHPIATYLISLAISDYAIIEDSLGALPIRHFVYPAIEAEARQDFSPTPAMIDAFENSLGVPFPFDKYGHALFENFGGAMEHQSCTSYGARLITGDNRYDLVVAHELGHQWFGDLVSPAEWDEIWLNEGLATWTEFLWTERADPASLPSLMWDAESSYMSYERWNGRYALYAPPPDELFGLTVYDKGGWVISMLRYLLGDDAFFRGMTLYLSRHAYGNVRTTDLRSAMEESSGLDLSAFFAQWVYGVGYPTYVVSWSASQIDAGRYQLSVRIRQTQTGTPIFTIPVEIETSGADGSSDWRRVQVTGQDVTLSYELNFNPAAVTVDPDNKILGTVRY